MCSSGVPIYGPRAMQWVWTHSQALIRSDRWKRRQNARGQCEASPWPKLRCGVWAHRELLLERHPIISSGCSQVMSGAKECGRGLRTLHQPLFAFTHLKS
ncbi:unnamed protein product [Pleuronectes platessa]|uniref:Uncharacterized protein n=1 Tax=Pleuronectes platessa TaxID=8262 RepID=A0A9N7YBD5_PLEPL|nr:unnamed protein product [Pleuronectes platessa]